MATWVIVGCGFTGQELARRLVAGGHDVIVTRRDAGRAEAIAGELGPRVRGIALDLAGPLPALPSGAIVACLAPPGADPAGEITRLATACERVIYVSSTGVYGAGHAAWVDEGWPLAPLTREGAARVLAERALASTAIALRAAGIHGPGRGLVDRLRAGTYRIVGDGGAHVSRIHVADLAQAIERAGERPDVTGPVNVADDAPDPIGLVADTLADRLGVPRPPRIDPHSALPLESAARSGTAGPFDPHTALPLGSAARSGTAGPFDPATASPELAGMLLADRRIANARMKRELGVVLRYPSWRDLA